MNREELQEAIDGFTRPRTKQHFKVVTQFDGSLCFLRLGKVWQMTDRNEMTATGTAVKVVDDRDFETCILIQIGEIRKSEFCPNAYIRIPKEQVVGVEPWEVGA